MGGEKEKGVIGGGGGGGGARGDGEELGEEMVVGEWGVVGGKYEDVGMELLYGGQGVASRVELGDEGGD